MSIFQKLWTLFRSPANAGDQYSSYFTVQCRRCGEQITGRIDLRNELSPEYDGGSTPSSYICRKVLIGSGQTYCFQQIEVTFRFDHNRKIIEKMTLLQKLVL